MVPMCPTLSTAPDTVNTEKYKLLSSLLPEHDTSWSDLVACDFILLALRCFPWGDGRVLYAIV